MRVDVRDVRADLDMMLLHRSQVQNSLNYFTNPMAGGMSAHPLAIEGLKAELDRTDQRIQKAKEILGIRSLSER